MATPGLAPSAARGNSFSPTKARFSSSFKHVSLHAATIGDVTPGKPLHIREFVEARDSRAQTDEKLPSGFADKETKKCVDAPHRDDDSGIGPRAAIFFGLKTRRGRSSPPILNGFDTLMMDRLGSRGGWRAGDEWHNSPFGIIGHSTKVATGVALEVRPVIDWRSSGPPTRAAVAPGAFALPCDDR